MKVFKIIFILPGTDYFTESIVQANDSVAALKILKDELVKDAHCQECGSMEEEMLYLSRIRPNGNIIVIHHKENNNH